ncbi:ArnT family glycosyltransferase [Bacteroidota bacterium]
MEQFEIRDKKQKYFLIVIILFLLGSLFANLGIYPLYHEEPRRGLIALEMIFSDNWIVPTIHGEFYYNKPPLYNWMLIFSYKLFGTYTEFATRIVSVISFLLLGWLTYFFTKKYVNRSLAIYSMLFFWIAADLYYYFSLTAEIDLFFSLITFLAFLSTFHFYQQKKWWLLFLSVYLLSALGFLTKGLPSIAFAGITLLGYFISQKNFKGLISWAHLAGIILFLLITGSYFYFYSGYNNPAGFLTTLYSQSTDRTSSDSGFLGFLTHILTFPFITFKDLVPVTILIVLFIPGRVFRSIRDNKWISFAALMVVLNILPYWLAPGTRSRYVYMLYPFIVIVILYLAGKTVGKPIRMKIINVFYGLIISIVLLVCVVLPFMPQLGRFSYIPYLSVAGGVFSLSILYLFIRFKNMRLLALIACMVLIRWIFDFTVLPIRQLESQPGFDKQDAHIITTVSDSKPVYVLKDTRISYTTLFYLEAGKEEIISRADEVESGNYYLSNSEYLEGIDYELKHLFWYRDTELAFVRVE